LFSRGFVSYVIIGSNESSAGARDLNVSRTL
jgi:hypothetical protein